MTQLLSCLYICVHDLRMQQLCLAISLTTALLSGVHVPN